MSQILRQDSSINIYFLFVLNRYNREEVVRSLGKEVNLNPPLTLGQLPDTPEELLKLDQVFIKSELKVGVIYVKEVSEIQFFSAFSIVRFSLDTIQFTPAANCSYYSQGQFSEENILDNNENSPLFEEFLQLLGDKVRLRGFDKYKGGLGEYCIVMHESCRVCSTWIRSKTPSGGSEVRLLNRKQGYMREGFDGSSGEARMAADVLRQEY